MALQELEDCLWKAGKQIVSGLNTGEPLSQASHAPELASQQCWQKVIGVGYTDKQKRDLIYRHVAKAMDCVRNVTGADAIMAKQLVDLLHARVHAGEHRRVTAASLGEQREQRVCAAITGSLAEFVSGLHAAGGAGRYPDKVTKAMHVSAVAWPWVSLLCSAHCLAACVALANSSLSCAPSPGRALAQVVATAVSNAAARNGVSYKEIGQRLGLSAEVIGKCKERFDELQNDGKWEQLFDDRGAVRNDALPEERKKFALQFWTDAELLNSAGQQYGFVRYSERAKDEIRDPANRTSKETFRIAWLEARVGDVYEAMKKAGVAKWPDFHMSQTVFSELRPFYVKDATRERPACASTTCAGMSCARPARTTATSCARRTSARASAACPSPRMAMSGARSSSARGTLTRPRSLLLLLQPLLCQTSPRPRAARPPLRASRLSIASRSRRAQA